MQHMRVDPAGLQQFAASCVDRADALRSALTAGSAGPTFQASAAAVTDSDALVAAASETLGQRVDDLSSKLWSAATSYLATDGLSGTALNGTIGGPT